MHFMALMNCGKEIIFRFQNKGKKSFSYSHRWSNTHFIFGTYLLTCVFIFFTNTSIICQLIFNNYFSWFYKR